jgi:hypothetical protein
MAADETAVEKMHCPDGGCVGWRLKVISLLGAAVLGTTEYDHTAWFFWNRRWAVPAHSRLLERRGLVGSVRGERRHLRDCRDLNRSRGRARPYPGVRLTRLRRLPREQWFGNQRQDDA